MLIPGRGMCNGETESALTQSLVVVCHSNEIIFCCPSPSFFLNLNLYLNLLNF